MFRGVSHILAIAEGAAEASQGITCHPLIHLFSYSAKAKLWVRTTGGLIPNRFPSIRGLCPPFADLHTRRPASAATRAKGSAWPRSRRSSSFLSRGPPGARVWGRAGVYNFSKKLGKRSEIRKMRKWEKPKEVFRKV